MKRSNTLMLLLALVAFPTLANSEEGHGKEEHGKQGHGKEEHGKQGHGEGHGKEGHGEGADKAAEQLAQERQITDKYVHKWIKLPTFTAPELFSGEDVTMAPAFGEATVVVFLASWCLPCQQLIGAIKKIERQYSERFTKFYYVFSYDTESDAKGFVQEHGLKGIVVMGTDELLKTYHQPPMPSIYVGDRYNWLVKRLVNTDRKGLAELDEFLKLHTSY